ncbi:FMN-binding glutamate synthase family protein [Altererythrobacter confluentis]|uniref:FMN-binding glutamate synthase family protein n=1 Tax=Allopontixanthobacter confluentis TaxID=1849021 RepID=A0A6L7GI27_9SPHN|nr:FMN-binding glutamate synthase family protein [Allopontixanthobacter confluentis]MXP15220.1 FMN-binding glutamate synthase family protein [Allopontixanthobacter confluentis]
MQAFAPRYSIPFMLLVLTVAAALWPPLRWALLGLVPMLLVALWDFAQASHALRRNYPLVARIRWIMEDLRPFAQAYIVEDDLEGRPFSHQERALVYARAKGELDSHPMGTELNVYSDEYEWLSHSIVPNDHAPQWWRVNVGGADTAKPYSSALLNISAMSFGSLSARAIEALNAGARMGNFAHNTGEGSISRYHRGPGGDLIWEIGSGYFGCRTDQGGFDAGEFAENAQDDQVKMIEIKLSQGAKPGHGGVLPGRKVTQEIAEARGITQGEDCVSPAAHSTFSTPVQLMEWVAQLRDLSGGKPVGMKLCVGKPHEVFALAKAMLATGITPDFITIDGAEGGTGAAPLELSNSVGMPMREGLIMMRNALVGAGLKDGAAHGVKLAASGKIHSGAQMAKAFALGADWCNAARPFMFSLGCVQSMNCHTGECPTGVATQEPWRQKGLIVEDKAPRVARFQRQTVASLREIVVAMGLDNPWEIGPHDMRERLNGAKSNAIDAIYTFVQPGQLLHDASGTSLGLHWHAASADTFRRMA